MPDISRDIGQMIAVGFQGESLDTDFGRSLRKQIESGLVSGIPLFYYNIVNKPQVKSLVTSLKEVKTQDPLLIMADMEGGKVQRFKGANGFTDFPSAKSVAATHSPAEAVVLYKELAEVLKDVGVNINLAPCIDVDDIPTCDVIGALERSYGTDPDVVARFGEAFVRAHRQVGVLTALKHFPGHGSARGDTHRGLVDITEVWREMELAPFRSLIKEGMADSVLTSHLMHRGVDARVPVTLSKTWIDRLRSDLGFDGVVITDCLHMGAMQLSYGFEETVVSSITAGHDLLLFSNNPKAAKGVEGFQPDPNLPEKILKIVERAVSEGKIDYAQIQRSAARVRKMKGRL